jgi:hypothetical protein
MMLDKQVFPLKNSPCLRGSGKRPSPDCFWRKKYSPRKILGDCKDGASGDEKEKEVN